MSFDCTVLLAVDSFKGCASSAEVERWLKIGIESVLENARVISIPVADGGEGTVDAAASICGLTQETLRVTGPCGDMVEASFAMVDSKTAVLEMAQSSGLMLTDRTEESARRASTFGVGEQILAALDRGATKIYIGLGGSATSDGGAGMAKALGARFYSKNGEPIACGLAGLEDLYSIDLSGLDPRLNDVEIIALTDVSNCLSGENGAIRVYGRQKGLSPESMSELDTWMARYARLMYAATKVDVNAVSGSGAAGGLGAALIAFCGARVERGIDFILDLAEFDKLVSEADFVVTGEGRIDGQSLNGKTPQGVAIRAKRAGKPVAVVAGSRDSDLTQVYRSGVDLVITSNPSPATLENAIKNAEENLVIAGETIARAYLFGSDKSK